MHRNVLAGLLSLVWSACAQPEQTVVDRPETRPADSAAAPDTTAVVSRPDTAVIAEDPEAGWTEGRLTGGDPTAAGTLTGVRVAAHDDYDRIVFDFGAATVPGYKIRLITGGGVGYRCGSGEPVRVAGERVVEVTFIPARAHTEEGQPTVKDRSIRPGLPFVQSLELVCDFEAHVVWLIGVDGSPRMRAAVLADPGRLVLDLTR